MTNDDGTTREYVYGAYSDLVVEPVGQRSRRVETNRTVGWSGVTTALGCDGVVTHADGTRVHVYGPHGNYSEETTRPGPK